ncbi:hypothetical protein SAMN05444955_108135 [Lihuaxuella thermophila]|uniref:Uncharacterized protein n=1 Tax=Lihuaxuella thermophila TaxID=1173111 RepID=A0A1H8FDB4_9BACL|nr:hypothetical protein SAMN05444955_108135 [Lihuaxuella thermophila]
MNVYDPANPYGTNELEHELNEAETEQLPVYPPAPYYPPPYTYYPPPYPYYPPYHPVPLPVPFFPPIIIPVPRFPRRFPRRRRW